MLKMAVYLASSFGDSGSSASAPACSSSFSRQPALKRGDAFFFYTSNFSETTSTTSQHFSGAFLKYSRQAAKIQSSVEAHGDEIGFLNFECCPGVLKLGS
jgi:hypothetical protein